MATYLQNTTEYIPQFQPFQPDYNFLGNVLQNQQSKYDSNYKALNKTYGTLLNSPMSRTDNIKQREEFFQMIDNDIKRMSGLDLSQQQNVDAADQVFKSFWENKHMVRDMVYTKEYRRQVGIGESYRNCIDQDDCGGKYWDTGKLALDYQLDEFKNADRDATLTMSPGQYVPQINIQEKAMKYAQTILGKNGAFGITRVDWSPDGRYRITTTNGEQLAVPLEKLLGNQYAKDQNVIDMFKTQAYVQRKSYIKSNAANFGGDENAAEDAYFKMIDQTAYETKLENKELKDLDAAAKAKKAALKKEIETKGISAYDQLANDYVASAIDSDASTTALDRSDKDVKLADSLYDEGMTREQKRRVVDGLFAQDYMSKEFKNSATAIAALTGEQTIEEDKYALASQAHAFAMEQQAAQYDLMDRNNLNSAIYGVVAEKFKSKKAGQITKRGPIWMHDGVRIESDLGTTSETPIDELAEIEAANATNLSSADRDVQNLVAGYANTLMTVIRENKDPGAVAMAKHALNQIYGATVTGAKKAGYNSATNTFISADGTVSDNPKNALQGKDNKTLYNTYTTLKNNYKNVKSQNQYFQGQGDTYEEQYKISKAMLNASSNIYKENGKSIKRLGNVEADVVKDLADSESTIAWNAYFKDDGDVKSKEEFIATYPMAYAQDAMVNNKPAIAGDTWHENAPRTKQEVAERHHMKAAMEAADQYEIVSEMYNKIYNGSHKSLKAIPYNTEIGGGTGGRHSGSVVYGFNSNEVASPSWTNLLSLAYDLELPETIVAPGNHMDRGDAVSASESDAAVAAEQGLRAFLQDARAGNLTEEDLGYVGTVKYMGLALGDPNTVGAIVRLPQSYIDSKKSKNATDAPTWADMIDPTEGIGVFIPKDKAKNEFTTNAARRPYDVILDYKNVTIDEYSQYGGNVTIQKRSNDGTFNVQGTIKSYYKDADGKIQEKVESLKHTISSADSGGNNIVVSLNTILADAAKINKAYVEGDSKNLIKDVNQIPDIKKKIDELTGNKQGLENINMADLFLNEAKETMSAYNQLLNPQ